MADIQLALRRKKHHPTFNVLNYGTRGRVRVKPRWRRQRGIDSKKRIKLKHMGAEPTIGYRNTEQIRGMRISGKRLILVHNTSELEELIHNKQAHVYDIAVGGAVSKRKRATIRALASKHHITLTNVK